MNYPEPDQWIWWKHGVLYHIYPRSFMDSNGDGIGDIQGIISKLKYISDLGADGIWLSPIYESPMVDFGYDVSNFRKIDPVFGTMDDFMQLIREAHSLGIRVILDMILNHTSEQHNWFKDSRSSLDSDKREWYIWRDGKKDKSPNNWKSVAGGSAWEYDEATDQYYYHSFFREQPDLNWRNEELSREFFEDIKYWLDLGVDGFRLDVINLIVKDKKFRNNPYFLGIPFLQDHTYTRNRRKSIGIVRELRKLVDLYLNKVLVGEVYTQPPGNSEVAARYLDEGKGLHMAFDFSLIFQYWSARKYFNCIQKWYKCIPVNGWPCNVLSNHDLFRSVDRFPWRRHKDEKAKVAAMLLLTLKGTPFIYYGEEIGMRNAKIKRRDIQDPFGKRYWPFFTGRDKARTPMQWDDTKYAGFSSVIPWLPLNRDSIARNVEFQGKETDSILLFYKDLINIRKRLLSLQMGRWVPLLTGRGGVLVYMRVHHDERTIIFLNFTSHTKRISLPAHSYGYVLFSTHRRAKEIHFFRDLRVLPFEATIFTETQTWTT